MRVDVDARGIEFQIQHIRRMTAMEQHVRVAAARRVHEQAIAHRASVDGQNCRSVWPRANGRLRDPAGQPQPGRRVLDVERDSQKLAAADFSYALLASGSCPEPRAMSITRRRCA